MHELLHNQHVSVVSDLILLTEEKKNHAVVSNTKTTIKTADYYYNSKPSKWTDVLNT